MREEKLNRFQKALMELSERVGGEVNYVVASIHEDVDAKPDVSSAPVHLADVASDALDADLQVLHTERDILEQIRSALRRIDEGQGGLAERHLVELREQAMAQHLRGDAGAVGNEKCATFVAHFETRC